MAGMRKSATLLAADIAEQIFAPLTKAFQSASYACSPRKLSRALPVSDSRPCSTGGTLLHTSPFAASSRKARSCCGAALRTGVVEPALDLIASFAATAQLAVTPQSIQRLQQQGFAVVDNALDPQVAGASQPIAAVSHQAYCAWLAYRIRGFVLPWL